MRNEIKARNDFVKLMTEKMEKEKNSFLKTYKETNGKMIEMIENHIIK